MLPRRPIRSFPRYCVAVLVPVAACAHLAGAPVDRARVVRVGHTVAELRYAANDAGEAERLERALQTAAPIAERWGPLPDRLTITVHPTHDALESASRIKGLNWIRAWARKDTIDLQSPRTWTMGALSTEDLAQLLAHELTHCVMYEAIGGEQVAAGMPAWFREGMATVTAGQRFSAPVSSLDGLAQGAFSSEDAPLAYVVANEAFLTLERRHGRERIRALLAKVRAGVEFSRAFDEALGTSLTAFESEFRASLPPTAG